MITLEEGAKRHEKLFPQADLQSQVYKLEEELTEFIEAESVGDVKQMVKELADVIIVCWGLGRFLPKTAWFCYRQANLLAYDNEIAWNRVLEQAEKKWLINEGRTWKFNGKVYKHVGKDGNE